MVMEKLKFMLLTAVIFLCMASCVSEQAPGYPEPGCVECEERIKELEDSMNDVIATLSRLPEAGAGDGEERITPCRHAENVSRRYLPD
jgi:hypothetical protein